MMNTKEIEIGDYVRYRFTNKFVGIVEDIYYSRLLDQKSALVNNIWIDVENLIGNVSYWLA